MSLNSVGSLKADLPPGTFVFQVRSRIGAGAWGPAAELRFEILPAWWQRAWAKGALLLGLVPGAVVAAGAAHAAGAVTALRAVVRVRGR